jgi:HEPN domain-containing protein
MTSSQAKESIDKEFATGRYARSIGNDGMVRVCARRAAGIAISYWLEQNPRQGRGLDAMSLLRNLQNDESMPRNIRDAAMRLTTRITGQFTSPFSTDPIDDSKIIINHLLP